MALIPGLILQGLGLGIVLTVNDPTGLTAVPDEDAGEAAGMINTAEQMGGALGIAILSALELGCYFNKLNDMLRPNGLSPDATSSTTGPRLHRRGRAARSQPRARGHRRPPAWPTTI